jgi:nicotinate-nucleotide adenylyltransferase
MDRFGERVGDPSSQGAAYPRSIRPSAGAAKAESSTRGHRRVGVIGGTFDPVHVAHLVSAEEARASLRLDLVVFVPARTPPHKLAATMSVPEHRLAMLALALGDNAAFATSRADFDRPGPHFTVDMLPIVRSELGMAAEDALWFVMGDDSLRDLPSWRNPPGIIAQARLAVVGRPECEPDMGVLEGIAPGIAERIDRIAMPLFGVSGTDIRRRIAEGRSIRYHVPDAVGDYIRDHRLYRACASGG